MSTTTAKAPSTARYPTSLSSHHPTSIPVDPTDDLPPSSRSPSPSKQGAIFETQRSTQKPTPHLLHLSGVNARVTGSNAGVTSTTGPPVTGSTTQPGSSATVRRPRYGTDERRRDLSISGDDWAMGLDRVDSPGPPSFGSKTGRGAAAVKGGYGGLPQVGDRAALGTEKVMMPVVVPTGPEKVPKEGTRTPPRLSHMPPPPPISPATDDQFSPEKGHQSQSPSASSPVMDRNHTRGPAVHITHPSTSTTASHVRQPSYNQAESNVISGSKAGSAGSTGSQSGAFADVVRMMQEGKASRESVAAGAEANQAGLAGSALEKGQTTGSEASSTGRPPKKRGNLIGPSGVLATMASKPSLAKLREIATASKASLTGSGMKRTSDESMDGSNKRDVTASMTVQPVELSNRTSSSAPASAQPGMVERRTTILRPAPPPPRSASPSSRFAAPSSTPGPKSLQDRGSGLLTNASPAALASADALFAPASGSNPNLHSAALASPARSEGNFRTASSGGGGWLHNPNVNVGAGANASMANPPLSARMSQGFGQSGNGEGLKRSLSVREDGTVEIPRFKRKELNLGMVPCGKGRRFVWMGLWVWCVIWALAGLFFDVNILYMLVQCATSPPLGPGGGSNSGWVFAVAAYGTCMFISIALVWLGWGVWYESWRKWRLPQPPIEPIHSSLPATLHLSLSSFPHFCFFLHTRLSMLGTRYTWDILPETAHFGIQTIPALLPILPRASMAVIIYVSFHARSSGIPLRGEKDTSFWAANGQLTGYARGVVLAFVLVSAVRLAVALASALMIFAFSKSKYDGPARGSALEEGRYTRRTTSSSKRHKYRPSLQPLHEDSPTKYNTDNEKTEPHTPEKSKSHKRDPSLTISPSKGWTAESESTWGWRERGRNRLQDAYELCMMRPSLRQSQSRLGMTGSVGRARSVRVAAGAGGIVSPISAGPANVTGNRNEDEGDMEKLASPQGTPATRGGAGRLLSPSPIKVHGRQGTGESEATLMELNRTPTRTSSPGKRSGTPTIRFADEQQGIVNGLAEKSTGNQSSATQAHTLQSGVGGYHADTAGSTTTLRAISDIIGDPVRPDSGVLPQGNSPRMPSGAPLGHHNNIYSPSGGMYLGAPVKVSTLDSHIANQRTGQAGDTGRPMLGSQPGPPSKDSLSSHEIYYTPMTQTPAASIEDMPAGIELGYIGAEGNSSNATDQEEVDSGVDSGSTARNSVAASAAVKIDQSTPKPKDFELNEAPAAKISPATGAPPRDDDRSESRTSSHTADESDSTALLAYDDFGYPSYPSKRDRRSRSPKKQYGSGSRSGLPGKRIKAVISSPSLKSLRDRAGSIVGRKAE